MNDNLLEPATFNKIDLPPMLASDFISNEIPILKVKDTCESVLQWMDEYRVLHMPVFSNTEYLGLISEADLLGCEDPEQDLQSFIDKMPKVFIQHDRPVYDVIKLMDDYKLSLVPVMDDKGRMIGLITYKEVIRAMVKAFNLNAPGAVFVLEMNYVDYALSEISRIVESNDARVLSSHISFHLESNLIDVTVKVNTESLSSIIQTLERYDYHVKASFQRGTSDDVMQERFEELMRYLNT